MNPNTRSVRATAQMKIAKRLAERPGDLTSDEIRKVVLGTIAFLDVEDVDAEAVVAELEASFQTVVGAERKLVGEDDAYEPWLDKRRGEIRWDFWWRYEQYLLVEKGWPQVTLDRLHDTTDRVLELLTSPQRPGAWDRRGMVVGHVQSGKTANYVGLVAKAADAGYKVIIVLAGFHKSLRSQTQIRLEEGFLGYEMGVGPTGELTRKPIGVGLIDGRPRADTITTRADNGDFNARVAKNFSIGPGERPLLFVVKKQGSVLRNLISWVKWMATARDETGRRYVPDIPLLVIDDEADQGSIDTRSGALNEDGTPDREHNPTVLNQRIRELLHLFQKSAYVGYTATPFANIFIHEQVKTDRHGEDLFPRSFILSLPAPSSYVGPAEVFGYETEDGGDLEPLPIVRRVDDHAETPDLSETRGWMPPAHKSDHVPRVRNEDSPPKSLQQAIRAFVLTCAARLARGQSTEHNSMLVHVTRFTAVQAFVAEQVRSELRHIQRQLKFAEGSLGGEFRAELHQLWTDDFEPTTDAIARRYPSYGERRVPWSRVEPQLERAALSISVREINGQAGEVLDYVRHEGSGLNVIAIGGDKLSRGLTLEGLSISYFLRASRMYDTLMQMGRWFGYRPGYLDLCRLYTTSELVEWYSHIASASEELRQDFNRMAASGGTPQEFGHRVRSHPLLLVTSQVKMRSGTAINVSFSGDISETINFWRTKARLEPNWKAGEELVRQIDRLGRTVNRTSPRGASTGLLWHGVPDGPILDFLSLYEEHPASRKVKTKLLADYIRKEVGAGRLGEWSVMVASGQGAPHTIASHPFRMVERSWHLTSTTGEQQLSERTELQKQKQYRIRRLVSPTDEFVDLTTDEYAAAMQHTLEDLRASDAPFAPPTRPSGPRIRQARPAKRGLLLLYPLDPRDDVDEGVKTVKTEKVEPDAFGTPVLGFAISFPVVPGGRASTVTYMVNNVYYRQEFGDVVPDDEEPV